MATPREERGVLAPVSPGICLHTVWGKLLPFHQILCASEYVAIKDTLKSEQWLSQLILFLLKEPENQLIYFLACGQKGTL